MSSIIKALLLLAVAACMSEAQFPATGQQCLCQGLSTNRGAVIKDKRDIKDIQIYPSTIFCDKVEIVVTMKNSYRFCLDPNGKIVQKLVSNIIRKRRGASTASTNATPVQSSTITPRI